MNYLTKKLGMCIIYSVGYTPCASIAQSVEHFTRNEGSKSRVITEKNVDWRVYLFDFTLICTPISNASVAQLVERRIRNA